MHMQSTSTYYGRAPEGDRLPNPVPHPQCLQLTNRAPINPSVAFQGHSSQGLLEDQLHYRNTSKYWDPLDTTKLDRRGIVYHEAEKQESDLKKIDTTTWVYKDENMRGQHTPIDNSTLTSAKKAWDGKPFSMIQPNPDGDNLWKKTYYGSRDLGLGCALCQNQARYTADEKIFYQNHPKPGEPVAQCCHKQPEKVVEPPQHVCPPHCRGPCNPLNQRR